nr:hypothetical protein CFP56_02618 [Quercus suber]
MVIHIRNAFDSPVPSNYRILSTARRLVVRHPGYVDSNNDLFALVATDGNADAPGIQMNIVHTACAVIANNRFDGWLSQSRDPKQPRVAITCSDLLPTGAYYFHVPSTDECSEALACPYPVVPNFRSWIFPHNQLPSPWVTAPIGPITQSTPAKIRDSTCRITQCSDSIDSAHIVPRAEKDWFAANEMDQYCYLTNKYGRDTADSDENLVQLRMDLHDSWDRMHFSIVPKQDQEQRQVWVVHANNPSQELHHIYHNRPLQYLSGIPCEFMFARFVWDMIHRIQGFLQRGVSRRLVVCGVVSDYTADQCRRFCENQGRYRSATPQKASQSPTKRLRSDNDAAKEVDDRSCDSGVVDSWISCSSQSNGETGEVHLDDSDSVDHKEDVSSAITSDPNGRAQWNEAAGCRPCSPDVNIYDENRRQRKQEWKSLLPLDDDPYGEKRRRRQQEWEQLLLDDDDLFGERRRQQTQEEWNSDHRGRKRHRS